MNEAYREADTYFNARVLKTETDPMDDPLAEIDFDALSDVESDGAWLFVRLSAFGGAFAPCLFFFEM